MIVFSTRVGDGGGNVQSPLLVIGTYEMLRDQLFNSTQSQQTSFESSVNNPVSIVLKEQMELAPQQQLQHNERQPQLPSQNQEQGQWQQQEEKQQRHQQHQHQTYQDQQQMQHLQAQQQRPRQQEIQQQDPAQQQLTQQHQTPEEEEQQSQLQQQRQTNLQSQQENQQQQLNQPSQVAIACSGPSNASTSGVKESVVTMLTSQQSSQQSRGRISSASTGIGCDQDISDTNKNPNAIQVDVPQLGAKAAFVATRKRQHTVYCVLHGIETSLNKYYDNLEECQANFDKEFARGFEEFLDKRLTISDAAAAADNNEDHQTSDDYTEYICDHLKRKLCPFHCVRLWKYCVDNISCMQIFKDLCGDNEGLVILSKIKENSTGTICKDYTEYKNMKKIGSGGFGKVYKYSPGSGQQLAIKEEIKHPLVMGSTKLFQKIAQLKHRHIIEMFEYIVGPRGSDGKQSYLFVMPFVNQKSLDKQFVKEKSCKCVLDYMKQYHDQQNYIYRNYLLLFHQVFDGLNYLQTQKVVHRDVKPSNILVHQKCSCQSVILCPCREQDRVVFILSDLDLVCMEGKDALASSSGEVWDKMAMHDPAGTMEMKSPESFYRTGSGETVISHKSDIWSGSVTMMNVLVGKEANSATHDQIMGFLKTGSNTIRSVTHGMDESLGMLKSISERYTEICNQLKTANSVIVNNEMLDITADFVKLKKVLKDSGKYLRSVQSFQGGVPEVYKEESPLAGILSTVYLANNLHWECLSRLPKVYDTMLWDCIKQTFAVIAAGAKFIPENRKDAKFIVGMLTPIERVLQAEIQSQSQSH
ncbi:uncharacterized protein [Dysidea avara]|uniref:uncharacterized protein isoform X2 n=1 Tax=Dysidea avara TaxID=196820 RepID=UPI0033290E98